MEDIQIAVCRLCLGLISSDECQPFDAVSTEILKVIVSEVDLDISIEPKICQICNKTMLRCYRFKSSCKKEDVKTVRTKKLDLSGTESITFHGEPLEKICSFCSASADKESLADLNTRKYFFNVLKKCLPEWPLTDSSNVVGCKECLGILTSQYKFIGSCLDTEHKLKNYCSTQGTNSNGKVNLYEVVRFLLADEYKNSDSTTEIPHGDIQFSASDIKIENIKMEEVIIKTEVLEEDVAICQTHEGEYSGLSEKFDVTTTESPSTSFTSKHTEERLYLNPVSVPLVVSSKSRKQSRKLKEPAGGAIQSNVDNLIINKRSIGVQVTPRDLVKMVNIGVQVDLKQTVPIAVSPSGDRVSSTTGSQRRRKKFKPLILRNGNKLS